VSEPASKPAAWLRLVGPLVAIALVSRTDVHEIVASLADVRWQPLGLSLALVAPLFVIKAWRWQLLLRACGAPISLGQASWLYTVSAGAGALTPGAVGDFWKGLSPAIGRRSVGLWTSAIDRLYDVAILFMLGAAISTAWIRHSTPRHLVAGALAVGLLALWLVRRRLFAAAVSLLPKFPSATEALHGSAGSATAATVFATIVALGRFELLVLALRQPLGWTQVFVAFVLSSGVAALPISIAGFGTRDLALVGYLRQCGVSSADAIALSSLCLLLFLWNGVVAAVLWLMRPPRASKRTAFDSIRGDRP
jgi:hypothetical protein